METLLESFAVKGNGTELEEIKELLGWGFAGAGTGHVCFPGNVSLVMGMSEQREKNPFGCGILFVLVI